MVDFKTADLNAIAHEIVEDGSIDTQEVRVLIERFHEDGEIDEEEVSFLFTINDIVCQSDENSHEYETFFIDTITDFLLEDPISPGRLCDFEWDWLKAKLSEDEQVDDLEIRLLDNIAEKSTVLPEGFQDFVKSFEDIDYGEELPPGTSMLFSGLYKKVKNKVQTKVQKAKS